MPASCGKSWARTETIYRVTCVGTLEDALARLAETAFDIVLLDLGLPDADGTEALCGPSRRRAGDPDRRAERA